MIGVFGDVVPHANPAALNGFPSSLKVTNLKALEDVLAKLRPPQWPASVFGKVDEIKAAKGEVLYKQKCIGCHELLDRSDLTTEIKTKMALFNGPGPNPGTDIWMACNAFDYRASAGPLAGFKGDIITEGKTIPSQAALADLLQATVKATLLDHKGDILESAMLQAFGITPLPVIEGPFVAAAPPPPVDPQLSEKQQRENRCKNANLGYTSRPLNGVWATAPFLHNGSVATMYELLLPPSRRSKSFHLGTRVYDPVKMGFLTEESDDNIFPFRTHDVSGKPIYGNSNAGHDYGNDKLFDDDRYAIIEYLKKL